MTLFIIIFAGLAVLALSFGVFVFLYISKEIVFGKITRSLNLKLISVALPKNIDKEQKPDKEVIAVMEQFYNAITSIHFQKKRFFSPKPYVAFEMAVPNAGEQISFYVAARGAAMDDIEKQIYSYFPKAQIVESEDFNIFNPAGAAVGAYVKLEHSNILPVRTYREMDSDPLKEIANALSKLEEIGDGAVLQLILRPSNRKLRTHAFAATKMMRIGYGLNEAVKEVEKGVAMGIFEAFFKREKPKAETERKGATVSDEFIKAVENKAAKNNFDANIRLVASASDHKKADDILRHLQNSFSQFNIPALNSFRFVEPGQRAVKKFLFNYAYRLYDEREKIILSSEELTGIYHFPNSKLETPKIKEMKSKVAEPPVDLPKEGLLIGRNIYRGEERRVFMSKSDRRRHLYMVGQTGTGKSNELKSLILQDIKNGDGVGVIDPHGDMAESILSFIPTDRYKDVVLVDPSDLAMPIGLNMLEYDPAHPEQKTFIVNELMNIFDKLYDLKQTGGPIFEQYTRNALQLLMEYPERGFTILEIPRVLSDREFRKSLLADCANILVKDFWEKEAEKAGGEASLQNLVPYITSKFNVFLGNDYIRPIIAQSKNTINFREIMDQKKILIVNLAKGRLGDVNASLLGLLIVGKLLMAAFSRVDIKNEEDRKDFYLYIDEFQNFATDSIATILSEARKYRLDLIIAHQFIEQLKKEIKDAVFGNVGNLMVFRVGAIDAEFLVKQFEPFFDQNDLVNIDNFSAYVKLLVDNKTTKPFSINAYPVGKGDMGQIDNIKRLSSLKYGRERAIVEREIMRRLRPEYVDQNTANEAKP